MAYEAEKNCESCDGTGDKRGRHGGRAMAGFQQCPTCKGTGKVLDLADYEDALTDGKKLRFVAEKGKFTINGAVVSRRMFMAALFTAMKFWERPVSERVAEVIDKSETSKEFAKNLHNLNEELVEEDTDGEKKANSNGE